MVALISKENKGPVYGIELINELPLGGGIIQAMPSRNDLIEAAKHHERTVAGYEVLLHHYRQALEECRKHHATSLSD